MAFRIFLLTAFCAFGQNPGDPFTLVRLMQVPAGPAVHPALFQMHRAARVPVTVLGLRSVTGPQQVWMVEAHGSFASVETTDQALSAAMASGEAEGLPPTSSIVGILRPGLSYRPQDALKALAGARYFQVTVFRTRPGSAMEFGEVMRIRNAALDQVNLDRPEVGYQVISGGESGTYIFLAPLQSLRVIDEGIVRTWGNPEGPGHAARQATSKLASEADLTREQLLFRVDPRISFVSESFAAGDPEFWNGAR